MDGRDYWGLRGGGVMVREWVKMSEPDHDPYAPPRSDVEVPVSLLDEEGRRRWDVMLRWAGAMSMGWLVVTGLVSWESGTVLVKMVVVLAWSGIFSAFLYGGRRWQLGIAMFVLVILLAQLPSAFAAMSRAHKFGTPVGGDEWWSLASVSVSCAITVVCGVALFVRGRKRG